MVSMLLSNQRSWVVDYHTIDNYYQVPAWNGIVSPGQMQEIITFILHEANSTKEGR